MNNTNSKQLFERSKKVIPGGVNSPVRAYKSVGGIPPFIAKAKGTYVWDVDGNKYIDFIGSWGPMILGHANEQVLSSIKSTLDSGTSFGAPTEAEAKLAELIAERILSVEMLRLVNSGTEATMSAIRLARGITKRDKIIKFNGCYHGHGDSFLISAGSGALTLGVPDSPGVTKGTASDTLVAEFNDIASVEKLFENNKSEIAAIIVEPICGNTGCIPPKKYFLEDLRNLCTKQGALLIFDEVMTGFRVARGGAAERYNIEPDIITMGKVIGGGMPIGAYGGKKEIMEHVAPVGSVYQAGTLSGNPIAVAAGLATLKLLTEESYSKLEELGVYFERGVQKIIDKHSYPLSQYRVGSMFTLFFTDKSIKNTLDVANCNLDLFKKYFHKMLERGVYLAPSQYEAGFISLAHSTEILDEVLRTMEEVLAEVFN